MIFEKIIITLVIIAILILCILIVVKNNRILEKIKVFKLKMLIARKKDEEARKYALKLVDKYPRNYLIHKILAQLYEKEGKYNVALDEYIRVVEIKNNDYETHLKVAQLLQKNEKKDEAIIMLQDLLKIKPDYLQATQLLGDILYEEERFKEAISIYITALKYYDIGMAFTRLNDFQRAKEYYGKAAELNTYLYNGQYNLALIAMIQGELDEAEIYFTQSLLNEELEPLGYYYLAQIALLKGQNEKAINYINLALELDKKIEEKISKQPLFEAIQDKIKIPNETRKIKITLSKKERKTNKYLEEMYNLVDALNSGKISKIEEEIEQDENEQENQQEQEKER